MTDPPKPYLMQAWLTLDDLDSTHLLDCRFEECDTNQPGLVHAFVGSLDIAPLLSDKQAQELIDKFIKDVETERLQNFSTDDLKELQHLSKLLYNSSTN